MPDCRSNQPEVAQAAVAVPAMMMWSCCMTPGGVYPAASNNICNVFKVSLAFATHNA